MNSNFFSTQSPFSNFNDFTDDKHFKVLPEDWSVLITDIRGSTKAISEGRYKDVNTIGAATIVVARKAMGNREFPFVFGGDGATLLIPNTHIEEVSRKLSSLKNLSKTNHGLELRIGVVSMKEILDNGYQITVGKYEITKGRSIAILKGNGLTYAEKLVKSNDPKYEFQQEVTEQPDLAGLSCRWNPIPSRNGKILTIIMTSRTGPEVYLKFTTFLSQLFPQGMESANPVNVSVSTYKSFGKLISDELRLHKSKFSFSFAFRALEIAVAVLLFKYNFPAIFFDKNKYAHSMRTHSDFRKFDDTLRMVIDCSSDQITAIKNYLEKMHEESELFYGTFETHSSLMTCYVDGLGQGQHIHFIDAEDGGYASAAIQLKHQIKHA